MEGWYEERRGERGREVREREREREEEEKANDMMLGLSGMGYMEISVSTTVFNTDFNSTTLPQSIEMERRQKRNNNGGLVGMAIASST